jgi:hypothetical protein
VLVDVEQLVEMQSDTAALENNLAASFKLKICLPYEQAILLLGIYPREIKTYVHTKTCT